MQAEITSVWCSFQSTADILCDDFQKNVIITAYIYYWQGFKNKAIFYRSIKSLSDRRSTPSNIQNTFSVLQKSNNRSRSWERFKPASSVRNRRTASGCFAIRMSKIKAAWFSKPRIFAFSFLNLTSSTRYFEFSWKTKHSQYDSQNSWYNKTRRKREQISKQKHITL